MLHEKIKMVFSAPPRLRGSISLWVHHHPCGSVSIRGSHLHDRNRTGTYGTHGTYRTPEDRTLACFPKPAIPARAAPASNSPERAALLLPAHPCAFVVFNLKWEGIGLPRRRRGAEFLRTCAPALGNFCYAQCKEMLTLWVLFLRSPIP